MIFIIALIFTFISKCIMSGGLFLIIVLPCELKNIVFMWIEGKFSLPFIVQ